MTKILLLIKRFFLLFGIEIRFVKRVKNVSAIYLNDVNVVNKAWASSKIENQFYSKEVIKLHKNIFDIFIQNANIPFKNVIDIGCGTGTLLGFFSRKYDDIILIGMEYSSSAINVARRNLPNARYILHDILNPFNEKFDVVLSSEVLEHIQYPERAFKNILNMVNKGGIILLTVPNGRIDTFEGHVNFWSIESWSAFIESNSEGREFKTGLIGKNIYALIYN